MALITPWAQTSASWAVAPDRLRSGFCLSNSATRARRRREYAHKLRKVDGGNLEKSRMDPRQTRLAAPLMTERCAHHYTESLRERINMPNVYI
jgi:hypothetical protein